jgi:hypothetical protein
MGYKLCIEKYFATVARPNANAGRSRPIEPPTAVEGGAKGPSTNGVPASPVVVSPIVATELEEEDEDEDAIIPQITFGADGGFILDTARSVRLSLHGYTGCV